MYIDVHTHTFPDKIAARTIKFLAAKSHTLPFADGSAAVLAQSMKQAGVDLSISLPVMTNPSQVEKVNRSLIEEREKLGEMGIVSFGGIHPEYENYKEELHFLKNEGVKGIKLHPAYQNTDLDDIRFLRIIGCASELGMAVTIHSGLDIGIPGHDYATVEMILNVIREVQPPKLIAAHMGGWSNWQDVEKYLAGAPLYLDSSFSMGPITPLPGDATAPVRSENMTGEDFLRLFRAHGADKVMFATDCPWADQGDCIKRFETLDFSPRERELFFHENARRIIGL